MVSVSSASSAAKTLFDETIDIPNPNAIQHQ